VAKQVVLDCSHEQFEGLHEAVNSVREKAPHVKVSKPALEALLRDHSRLLKEHEEKVRWAPREA
jgi:hypothetical protein